MVKQMKKGEVKKEEDELNIFHKSEIEEKAIYNKRKTRS